MNSKWPMKKCKRFAMRFVHHSLVSVLCDAEAKMDKEGGKQIVELQPHTILLLVVRSS